MDRHVPITEQQGSTSSTDRRVPIIEQQGSSSDTGPHAPARGEGAALPSAGTLGQFSCCQAPVQDQPSTSNFSASTPNSGTLC